MDYTAQQALDCDRFMDQYMNIDGNSTPSLDMSPWFGAPDTDNGLGVSMLLDGSPTTTPGPAFDTTLGSKPPFEPSQTAQHGWFQYAGNPALLRYNEPAPKPYVSLSEVTHVPWCTPSPAVDSSLSSSNLSSPVSAWSSENQLSPSTSATSSEQTPPCAVVNLPAVSPPSAQGRAKSSRKSRCCTRSTAAASPASSAAVQGSIRTTLSSTSCTRQSSRIRAANPPPPTAGLSSAPIVRDRTLLGLRPLKRKATADPDDDLDDEDGNHDDEDGNHDDEDGNHDDEDGNHDDRDDSHRDPAAPEPSPPHRPESKCAEKVNAQYFSEGCPQGGHCVGRWPAQWLVEDGSQRAYCSHHVYVLATANDPGPKFKGENDNLYRCVGICTKTFVRMNEAARHADSQPQLVSRPDTEEPIIVINKLICHKCNTLWAGRSDSLLRHTETRRCNKKYEELVADDSKSKAWIDAWASMLRKRQPRSETKTSDNTKPSTSTSRTRAKSTTNKSTKSAPPRKKTRRA